MDITLLIEYLYLLEYWGDSFFDNWVTRSLDTLQILIEKDSCKILAYYFNLKAPKVLNGKITCNFSITS